MRSLGESYGCLDTIKLRAEDVLKKSNMISTEAPTLTTLFFGITLGWFIISVFLFRKKKNLPPGIAGGVPLLGHILQMRNKKPHLSFTDWAEEYGPIFCFKAGSTNAVVVSSAELAKEVLVTKHDLISKRRLPTAFQILSGQKVMVSMSDYGDEHKMLKKIMVGQLAGFNPQKGYKSIREETISGLRNYLVTEVPVEGMKVNVREVLQHTLLAFGMRQVLGFAPKEVDVPEVGKLDMLQMFKVSIIDCISTATVVDWRNLWPTFSWVPNYSMERKVEHILRRKDLLVRELVKMAKKKGPTPGTMCEFLFSDAGKYLTDRQVEQLIWEAIITQGDTSTITNEWTIYELATHPDIQERLYNDIRREVGDRPICEDDLPNLPLLNAIFKETLRRHNPLAVLPSRTAEADITLGGYDVPKGWDVIVNQWGVGMDKKVWFNPEVWDPDRCLSDPKIDLGVKDMRILPFGAGKRMCVGINQAMTISTLIIGTLIQQFEWHLDPADGDENDNKITGDSYDISRLTSHKATPLQAFAKPRMHV